MKPTEIKPLDNSAASTRPESDRLTPLLSWLVFFLVAGLAAILADLWLRPGSSSSVAEAVGPVQSAVASTPLPSSTTLPVLVASQPLRSSAVGVPVTPAVVSEPLALVCGIWSEPAARPPARPPSLVGRILLRPDRFSDMLPVGSDERRP